MTEVVIRGVGKSYGRRGEPSVAALNDVRLHAASGSFVSIVGPSGCGKSTLLRLLAGLEEPTMGQILLDGLAHRRLGRSGYMPQHDALLPWRGVVDNAAVALEMKGMGRGEARQRAAELLPIFGLEEFASAYPTALSGGMRQRVALLRTMLGGQPLLLLDEPFGALDALTRASMQEWLLGVWARFRQTVLFVTHDVDEALYLSDTVVVMSARPGTVGLSCSVDLPRPRLPYAEMVTAPPLVALKRQVLAALRDVGGFTAIAGRERAAGGEEAGK